MTYPTKLDGLLVKIEGAGTYGTDAAPTVAADEIRIADRLWPAITVERAFPNMRENHASGDLGPATPALPQGPMATLSIPVELNGPGAAYAANSLPAVDPLLRSCGMARADSFPTSVTYTPSSTVHGSCTIWAYTSKKIIKVVGCRGTTRWPITPGETAMMVFDMQGYITDVTSELPETALPAMTYAASLPPGAVGMAFTVGAWSPKFQSAEVVLNANVQRMDSGNAAGGVRAFEIASFEPKLNLVAETELIATYNPNNNLVGARTAANIDWTVGATQYNKISLDMNSAWIENDPTHEVFNDFCAWGLTYGCKMANMNIVFT